MTQDETFLAAILANPDDQTAKLAYADWLDEADDPRAEVVRLKVAVASMADGWEAAQDRLAELEPTLPAKWLVMLDGPVWCISGNIVQSRPFGPGGTETRLGTRLFKPNAKVYLAETGWAYTLFNEPHGDWECIRVVGRHRKSLDWIGCIVRTEYTTNWRVELVYQPGILVRLKMERWPGFHLKRGEFKCPEDKASPEAIRSLLEVLGRIATPGQL
jgi:uncharacterized protein (TIGR02996 family)